MKDKLEKLILGDGTQSKLPILIVGNNSFELGKVFQNYFPNTEIYCIRKENHSHYGKFKIIDSNTKEMREAIEQYSNDFVSNYRKNEIQ